jgi:PadR family transcriptional regulator PadR
MRSTDQLGRVLHAMLETPASVHYGFDLLRRTGLKSGSLYPILARMEAEGLVTSSWEDVNPSEEGRPRRRYYELTGAGADLARKFRPAKSTSASSVRPSWGMA